MLFAAAFYMYRKYTAEKKRVQHLRQTMAAMEPYELPPQTMEAPILPSQMAEVNFEADAEQDETEMIDQEIVDEEPPTEDEEPPTENEEESESDGTEPEPERVPKRNKRHRR